MRIKSTLTTALLAATLINLDQWLHPDAAHAVFFQVAEVWLTGIFTTTGNTAAATGVSLTINIIRAILLIWIALGIVRTVQAARNDEDDTLLQSTNTLVV